MCKDQLIALLPVKFPVRDYKSVYTLLHWISAYIQRSKLCQIIILSIFFDQGRNGTCINNGWRCFASGIQRIGCKFLDTISVPQCIQRMLARHQPRTNHGDLEQAFLLNFTLQLKFFRMINTMQVFDFSPINESRKTCVSFDARNGRCAPLRPRARMHSFKASSDLLISAPSIPVIQNKLYLDKE